MAPQRSVRVCVCVFMCMHTSPHTHLNIPAMGGKAQAALVSVCVLMAAPAHLQGPGETCTCASSLPALVVPRRLGALPPLACNCGGYCYRPLPGLLPNPVEGLQVPRKALRSETKSGQRPRRGRH